VHRHLANIVRKLSLSSRRRAAEARATTREHGPRERVASAAWFAGIVEPWDPATRPGPRRPADCDSRPSTPPSAVPMTDYDYGNECGIGLDLTLDVPE